MSKIFILSCLCLVILYINYVDAQNRLRTTTPAKRSYKKPPARVLNKVEPKVRTRQQQMQIKRRQSSTLPQNYGKVRPAQVRAYQHDWCIDNFDGRFSHESECDSFYYCDDDGNLAEWFCEEDTPIFDWEYLMCMSEEEGICLHWVENETWEGECPSDPYEVVFLPGESCSDYFICLSGWPAQWSCAPGQHWNHAMGHCDTPANAQCDPSIAPSQPSLPDCQNTIGTVPHPFDCRQFIFCQKNGSRMVQNCPHLLAYDIDLNKCVIEHQAKCGTAYSQNKLRRN